MKVYTRNQIEKAIEIPSLLAAIEEGLIRYSEKRAHIAPVSFLHFKEPVGDVHIKSGALLGHEFYVVKIASGFYDNPKIGLSSSNGLMLLFSQKTGELAAILLDEGRLTDLRTALAGAIAAKHVANRSISKIGIIGTGTQAKEQLFHLQFMTDCRDVLVWGRDPVKAKKYAEDPYLSIFKIEAAKGIDEITESCNLIITATTSTNPLLFGHQLRPGTHITAVGADDYGKQELDSTVFDIADLIVVDSFSQCSRYGDLAHANAIESKLIIELGTFLKMPQARQENWITVADLTGVAVEDLQIANAVFANLNRPA
jgi:ornithine cyclodeaminase